MNLKDSRILTTIKNKIDINIVENIWEFQEINIRNKKRKIIDFKINIYIYFGLISKIDL